MIHFYTPWKRQQGLQKWKIGLKWVNSFSVIIFKALWFSMTQCVQKLILTHPYDMNLDNFRGKGKSYASFSTWKENSVKHENFSKFYDHDCTLTCCIVSIHYFLDFMVRKFYCHFHLFILIQTRKTTNWYGKSINLQEF